MVKRNPGQEKSADADAKGRRSTGMERLLRGTAAAITGTFLLYNACTTYIRPNEYGIKQVEVSPFGMLGNKGIQEKVYDTGLHIVWPIVEKIHKFPKDTQVLHLHREKIKNVEGKTISGLTAAEEQYATEIEPANIQTSDGFYITLDVSVLYKIVDPYKTITTLGAGKLFEQNGIIPKTEPGLKEALGVLNPEDFYNSPLRVSKQNSCRDLLKTLLKAKGIDIDHVLIRYPEYHPDVQARIEGRKLQDQLVYTNQAKARERAVEADYQKITQEGIAAKNVRLEEADAYVTRKTAEKDLYDRVKRAEANKLINLAEAEKKQVINDAYKGQGSERLVGLEMAKVLKGLKNIVITTGGKQEFNPLDLESITKSWGIYETKEGNLK